MAALRQFSNRHQGCYRYELPPTGQRPHRPPAAASSYYPPAPKPHHLLLALPHLHRCRLPHCRPPVGCRGPPRPHSAYPSLPRPPLKLRRATAGRLPFHR